MVDHVICTQVFLVPAARHHVGRPVGIADVLQGRLKQNLKNFIGKSVQVRALAEPAAVFLIASTCERNIVLLVESVARSSRVIFETVMICSKVMVLGMASGVRVHKMWLAVTCVSASPHKCAEDEASSVICLLCMMRERGELQCDQRAQLQILG